MRIETHVSLWVKIPMMPLIFILFFYHVVHDVGSSDDKRSRRAINLNGNDNRKKKGFFFFFLLNRTSWWCKTERSLNILIFDTQTNGSTIIRRQKFWDSKRDITVWVDSLMRFEKIIWGPCNPHPQVGNTDMTPLALMYFDDLLGVWDPEGLVVKPRPLLITRIKLACKKKIINSPEIQLRCLFTSNCLAVLVGHKFCFFFFLYINMMERRVHLLYLLHSAWFSPDLLFSL